MAFDVLTGDMAMSLEEIKKLIAEHEIKMVRLEWCDLQGILRGKLMPAEMIDTLFKSGIAFAAVSMSLGFDNSIAIPEDFSENYDDMKVFPDASTFSILPHEPHTAVILGDMYYHDKPMVQSPRAFLKKMVEEYRALGFDPICASEVEFFVYNKQADGTFAPYTTKNSNCYAASRRSDPTGFLRKLTDTFKEMQFNVLYMNHEYYPGQFEYNWSHAKAVKCADETCRFKTYAKDIADDEDMMVTFMAKPKMADGGSGCHFHISLEDLQGENVFYDANAQDGISDLMRHFIAGITKHAKAMTAFLSPTVNCYKRYQPDSFAPIYIGWGFDNRTTFLRVPDERKGGTRVEIRAASAATNPYLALGIMLAAGLDGIKNKLLPEEPVLGDLYHAKDCEKEMVPRSLFRAVETLKEDTWLQDCAGKEMIHAFSILKELEIDAFCKYVTDWEWETYSYHV